MRLQSLIEESIKFYRDLKNPPTPPPPKKKRKKNAMNIMTVP